MHKLPLVKLQLAIFISTNLLTTATVQKMKYSFKDFFSKCDQICRKLRIWSHLLKKFFTENFIFCVVCYWNFNWPSFDIFYINHIVISYNIYGSTFSTKPTEQKYFLNFKLKKSKRHQIRIDHWFHLFDRDPKNEKYVHETIYMNPTNCFS